MNKVGERIEQQVQEIVHGYTTPTDERVDVDAVFARALCAFENISALAAAPGGSTLFPPDRLMDMCMGRLADRVLLPLCKGLAPDARRVIETLDRIVRGIPESWMGGLDAYACPYWCAGIKDTLVGLRAWPDVGAQNLKMVSEILTRLRAFDAAAM